MFFIFDLGKRVILVISVLVPNRLKTLERGVIISDWGAFINGKQYTIILFVNNAFKI